MSEAQNNGKEGAKQAILDLFNKDKNFIAYDREIRYRLESKYPHDVIGEAIKQLEKEGKLKRTNLPGRRSLNRNNPNVFYRVPDSNWKKQLELMRKKFELSLFITHLLPEMGEHAEKAWWRAFRKNGWYVEPEKEEDIGGINCYKNKKASINNDIDFIVSKDGIAYGVEVKNGLTYPDDLYFKVRVAIEIDVIPLVIARWLNPRQINVLKELKIPFIIYKEALVSSTFEPMVNNIKQYLQYPIIAKDEIDDEYFKYKVDNIHEYTKKRIDDIKSTFINLKNPDYVQHIMKALGHKH
ncbi:MAG: hypothetical protein QXL44_06055 [Candidatus Nitrosocaldus sp.]